MRDDVDRLTPLGLMVLALLGEGDMHPYEMIRLIRMRRDDRLARVSNGTLYHTVARLEQAGLVSEVGVDREGSRPERTTYSRTGAGAAAVGEWVRRELPRVDRPAEFRVALAEAHNLGRDEAVRLLRVRREALSATHRALAEAYAHARDKGVADQFLLEVDCAEALGAAELTWLDDVIARIADSDFLWGPDHEPSERYLAQRKAARR